MNQYKGDPQHKPQVLPFQQSLMGNNSSNLDIRKIWKKKNQKLSENPKD